MLGLYYILSFFGLFRDAAKVVETEASISKATKDEIPATEDPAAKAGIFKANAAVAAAEAEASGLAKVEAAPNKVPKAEVAVTKLAKAETPAMYSSTREAAVSYLTLATTYLPSFTLEKSVLKVGSTGLLY